MEPLERGDRMSAGLEIEGHGRTIGRRAGASMAASLLATLAFAGGAGAATYTPNTFGDGPANGADCLPASTDDCSLRDAVEQANNTPENDEVVLAAGTYELDPHELGLRIWNSTDSGTLLVRGQGARATIIDAGALLDEVHARGFTFTEGSDGELRDLAVTGGTHELHENPDGFDGGAIAVQDDTSGGNDAKALLTRVRLFDNHVRGDGGAIKNRGQLTIVQSLIDGNSARESGGGIENDDELRIVNSTISGNEALGEGYSERNMLSEQWNDGEGNGGGIDNDGDHAEPSEQAALAATAIPPGAAYLHVESSTITGNSAAGNGGGVSTKIVEQGETFLHLTASDDPIARFHNSVVSGNTADGDSNCSGNGTAEEGVFESSEGHNIEDGTSCAFEAEGDLDDDPKLGPLADNGGGTNTHALTTGSPAIDAADSECPEIDQRGVERPRGQACDMGAFEAPRAAKPDDPEPGEPKPGDPQPGGDTPLPPPRTPEARNPRCLDTEPPLTRLTRNGLRVTKSQVRLAGSSKDRGAPCISGVQRVEVSLAKVSGTDLNCRFVRRSTKFLLSPFMNCRRPIRFVAEGTNRWYFHYRVKLARGKYRAQARGYDEARNKETPKKRRNIVTFEVR